MAHRQNYTVSFTSVHAGKYGQKTNLKQTLQTLKTAPKQHKTQQNKTSLVQSLLYDWIVQCLTSPPTQYRLYGRHSARKRGGLILQRSWAHTGLMTYLHWKHVVLVCHSAM